MESRAMKCVACTVVLQPGRCRGKKGAWGRDISHFFVTCDKCLRSNWRGAKFLLDCVLAWFCHVQTCVAVGR